VSEIGAFKAERSRASRWRMRRRREVDIYGAGSDKTWKGGGADFGDGHQIS